MRVLFVTTTLDVGGAEVMLVELARHLIPAGIAVGVASLAGDGAHGENLRALGATVFPARSRREGIGLARRAVAAFAPDVVHGWMYHGNVAAWTAARLRVRPLPLVWTVHQSLYDIRQEKPTTNLLLRLSRHISRSVDMVTYVSDTSRKQHRAFGFEPRRECTLANGFAVPDQAQAAAWRRQHRDALGIGEHTFVVGQVGRHHPVKNHAGMIRIAARLARAQEDICLLLVGGGMDAGNDELMQAIDAAGIRERVMLLGQRSDARELMAALDALCVPSLAEAFPMVIGEAMGVGVPCVASDVGDIGALLQDIGVALPVQDEQGFADALLALARRDPQARARDAEHARASILQRFGLAQVAGHYLSLYEGFVRTRGA